MTPTEARIVEALDQIVYALCDINAMMPDMLDANDGRVRMLHKHADAASQLVHDLVQELPLYRPSQPNKEATAPAGDANQAAPEFASHSVGDYVQFTINAAGDKRTGFIRHISGDGMATIIEDVTRLLHFKDLCALKNLSRQEKP